MDKVSFSIHIKQMKMFSCLESIEYQRNDSSAITWSIDRKKPIYNTRKSYGAYFFSKICWSCIFRNCIVSIRSKLCHFSYWVLLWSIFICSRYIYKSLTNSRFNSGINKILGTKCIYMKKLFKRVCRLCSFCSECRKMEDIRGISFSKNFKNPIAISNITLDPKWWNFWRCWKWGETINSSCSLRK